jgi:hypothetical protein
MFSLTVAATSTASGPQPPHRLSLPAIRSRHMPLNGNETKADAAPKFIMENTAESLHCRTIVTIPELLGSTSVFTLSNDGFEKSGCFFRNSIRRL